MRYLKVENKKALTSLDELKLKLSSKKKYNDMCYKADMRHYLRYLFHPTKSIPRPIRKNFFKKNEYYYDSKFGWGLIINIKTMKVNERFSGYHKNKVIKINKKEYEEI